MSDVTDAVRRVVEGLPGWESGGMGLYYDGTRQVEIFDAGNDADHGVVVFLQPGQSLPVVRLDETTPADVAVALVRAALGVDEPDRHVCASFDCTCDGEDESALAVARRALPARGPQDSPEDRGVTRDPERDGVLLRFQGLHPGADTGDLIARLTRYDADLAAARAGLERLAGWLQTNAPRAIAEADAVTVAIRRLDSCKLVRRTAD